MDIDILSKMIRNLILDFNEVTLPGMGTFVAEYVPSSISDKGLTINPPYRRLYFRQKLGTDTRLVDLYSESAKLDKETAFHEISDFIAELKNTLKLKKNILLPGLGRLRATRENLFFFVSDDDLDICPESFGLHPVSMKAHDSEYQEAATPAPVQALPIVPDPDAVSEPSPESEPEPSPELAPASEPVPSPKSALEFFPESEFDDSDPYYSVHRSFFEHTSVRIIIMLLALAVIALVLLAVIGRLAPDMVDPLLYNQEELQILRF